MYYFSSLKYQSGNTFLSAKKKNHKWHNRVKFFLKHVLFKFVRMNLTLLHEFLNLQSWKYLSKCVEISRKNIATSIGCDLWFDKTFIVFIIYFFNEAMNACFMFLQFDALLHLLIPSVKFYTSITVQCFKSPMIRRILPLFKASPNKPKESE